METIAPGDRGILVLYLQLALNRAGYMTDLDGIFGTSTCKILNAFLRMETDCTVTDEVWNKLIPYLKGYTRNPSMVGEVPVVFTSVPYTSLLNEFAIEGLVSRYPFLSSFEIGKSVMGKPILALKIGTGNKQMFYSASFHANESITTPVLLKFAEDYARAYARGGEILGHNAGLLFEEYELNLVPMVNPDGVDLVNGLLTSGEFYERAAAIASRYPQIPFPSGWKANIDGVDLNLQFPAGWELAKEIKYAQGYTGPAPRDYVGEAPLTAPESKAVYDFTVQNGFGLILAYHTQGKVIFWKYRDYNPPYSGEIADYFASVSGYAVEETPAASGNAGYKDWFIMTYNRPGYTIEAGEGENPLPMSQFDEIYEDNIGILLGGMTQLK